MANKWNIPKALESEIFERDKICVYCGKSFTSAAISRRSAPSWEHIIIDARIVTKENIALCCRACNSSKGNKSLSEWLRSKYCKEHDISYETVAPIVRSAIENG